MIILELFSILRTKLLEIATLTHFSQKTSKIAISSGYDSASCKNSRRVFTIYKDSSEYGLGPYQPHEKLKTLQEYYDAFRFSRDPIWIRTLSEKGLFWISITNPSLTERNWNKCLRVVRRRNFWKSVDPVPSGENKVFSGLFNYNHFNI